MISLTRLTSLTREIRRRGGSIGLDHGVDGRRSSLVAIRTFRTGNPACLFLMHPIGGSVMAYHDLARYLHPEQPVYAIENQVFASCNERLHKSIEEMAAQYIGEIRAVSQKDPYLLGGYSMGGLLAFEMARQLRAGGSEVALVAVIDTPARVRMVARDDGDAFDVDELMLMGKIMAARQGREPLISRDELEALEPERRLSHFVATLRSHSIVPPNADDELLASVLRLVRNNEEAQRRYVPGIYEGKVTLFRATGVSPELREEAADIYNDPLFGWQSHCTEPVELQLLAGGHLHLMNGPHVRALGQSLPRSIDRCRPRRAISFY